MKRKIQNNLPSADILWQRPVYNFNYKAGKVLIIAGSGVESQKAIFAAEAAFQSGTGILTLAFPESLEKSYRNYISIEMLLPLPETPSKSISLKAKEMLLDFSNSNKVTIIGPGLSKNSETSQLIWELIFELNGTILITDDAVKPFLIGLKLVFSKGKDQVIKECLSKIKSEICLIISKSDLKNLNFLAPKIKNQDELLSYLSVFLNITIILIKDNVSIAFPNGDLIENQKKIINQKLASIISGVIGSFIAQNQIKKEEAIQTAVYIVGETISRGHIDLKNIRKTIREIEKDLENQDLD